MSEKKQKKRNSFLVQGTILAVAGVITKIIGIVYRVPLINILGDKGMAYYGVAFQVYTVALMLTSYSLPMAVSKLVSARVSVGQYKNAFRVFKGAMTFAVVSGGLIGLGIFVGADFIAGGMMQMPMSAYALRVLAPCLLIVAILGVLRGFFQGYSTMMPTAVSQILEQIINAIVSIGAAYMLLKFGQTVAESTGKEDYGIAYAAAGGTLGTIAGAFIGVVFVMFVYVLYKDTMKRQMKRDQTKRLESRQYVYRVLFATIGPVVLSATVYNISNVIDCAVFNTIMSVQGFVEDEYAPLLGMFTGKYEMMINVPLSVASALAASFIPSLMATIQTGDRRQIHHKISTASRFNMLLAIPCAVGFIVLARPLLDLLFRGENNAIAATMLRLGSIAIISACLSTVTNAALQGLDKMMLPIKNAVISLVIHLVALLIMMVVFKWGIYSVVISKIVFSGAICILNAHDLRESVGYVQERKRAFIIPTIASVIMGVIALLVHLIFTLFLGSTAATLFAIFAAMISYGVSLLLLGGLSEEELLAVPKGATIVSLLRKIHLIKGEYR